MSLSYTCFNMSSDSNIVCFKVVSLSDHSSSLFCSADYGLDFLTDIIPTERRGPPGMVECTEGPEITSLTIMATC